MAPRDHEKLGDWQPSCSKVKKRTLHLHDSKEWSDCTFRFDCAAGSSTNTTPQFIRSHKLILAMASPVFAAQFYGSLVEQEPIFVKDIDSDTFKIMLKYIYTDDIEVYSVREAINVYYAAKKYILPYLQEDCIEFLLRELSPHNVCRIYEFSLFHDEIVLKQKCLKIFSKKTINVLKSSHFYKAKTDTVKKIVSMDHLNIGSEMDLFNALLRYSEHEITNAAVAENMATTICFLFEKRSSKAKVREERSESRSSSSSIKSLSDGESDGEDRPSLSSVIVPKKTGFAKLEEDQEEMIRKSLRPCVQQVRFLTLSPREFAECSGLSSLLTNEEIMAISMNIASKDTAVPMPEGFSKSLLPRNQHHSNPVATIRFTVNNIAQVRKFTSEVFCARNIPWSVTILLQEKRKSNSEERKLYLRLYVDCLLQRDGSWSIGTEYTIRTILSIVNNQSFDLPLQKHAYCFTNERKRSSHLYHWNTVRPASTAPAPRPNCTHAADNSITFEVKIEPSKLRVEPLNSSNPARLPPSQEAAIKKK